MYNMYKCFGIKLLDMCGLMCEWRQGSVMICVCWVCRHASESAEGSLLCSCGMQHKTVVSLNWQPNPNLKKGVSSSR